MARFLPNYMKGCFFILRLFCLFPLKILNCKVEISYFYCVYSIIAAIIYTGVFNYAFLWEDRSKMGIIYAANPILGYASYTNMLIPLFLVPVITTNFWTEFYHILLVIDSILESHGGIIPYKRQKIEMSCLFAVLILFWALTKLFDLLHPSWGEMHVMNHFSHTYSLLTLILVWNVTCSAMFLRSRFQCVNFLLISLFKNPKLTPEALMKNIQTLQRAHNRLCQLSLKLNAHFTCAVLLTLANTCGAFLTSLYGAFTTGTLQCVMDFLSTGKWHCIEIIVIVGLLLPFDLLKSEANNTGSVLHEAFLDAQDFKNEFQVNTFSLQLIHNKLVFSTGLFNTSMTIALPAASAITTYLVIFVQFSNK